MSLRAQVRHRSRWRALAGGLLALGGLLTVGLFSLTTEPAPVPEFEICLNRDARAEPVCQEIQPTYQTWDYRTLAQFTAARSHPVAQGKDNTWLLEQTRPHLGVQNPNNMEFLSMVQNLELKEEAAQLTTAQRRHIEAEFQALVAIEDAFWDVRVVNRSLAATMAFERAQRVRAALVGTIWLWVPAVLFSWIVLLVLIQRITRRARPLSLDVGTGGVCLDGQRISRASIAFLSLEGQRLRIERWTGPPVYSRPLPPEALVYTDEICASLGLLGEEEVPDSAPNALPALRRLMADSA